MKRFLNLSLLAIFSSICAHANINEHSEFSSIFNYLTPDDYHKNTVVVLDIDNTIATLHAPFQLFGSDAWVSYEIAKLTNQGVEYIQAVEQVLPLYFKVAHIIDLRPVEPTTLEIIHKLQDLGIIVIACTMRSLQISDRTIAQLNAINIDFTKTSFGDHELLSSDSAFLYKNGIIFCLCRHKGISLQGVLNHFNHTPTKVIMVDDREHYLHQIKQVLHPDIQFIGIRYSHMDEHVAQFDSVIAEQEKQAYLATL